MKDFTIAALTPIDDADEQDQEVRQVRQQSLTRAQYLRDCILGVTICLMGTMTRTTGREAVKDSSLVEAVPKELFEIAYALACDVKDMARENTDNHESDIGFVKVKHIKDRSPDVTWPLYLVISVLHLSGLDNQGIPRSSLISGEDREIPLLQRKEIHEDEVGILSAVIEHFESLHDFVAICEGKIQSYLGHVHFIEPYAMYEAALLVYDTFNLAQTGLDEWFIGPYFQALQHIHQGSEDEGPVRFDFH